MKRLLLLFLLASGTALGQGMTIKDGNSSNLLQIDQQGNARHTLQCNSDAGQQCNPVTQQANIATEWTAAACTGTITTATPDSLLGLFASVGLQLTWPASGTGSPSGCTIQLKTSNDNGVTFNANGAAQAVTVGTPLMWDPQLSYALGSAVEYVFACSVYPTGSPTITLKATYNIAPNPAATTTVAGTVTATVTGGTIQGTTGGQPVSVQGSADGGLPVYVAGTVTANMGADGGNTRFSISDMPGTVLIDAGTVSTLSPSAGQVIANGTTPTYAPAGVPQAPSMSQQLGTYVAIGPPNPIHYYESTSSKALVIPDPIGQSFYITDFTLSAGTTAQEVQLDDCDAGTHLLAADAYLGINGGVSAHQITPIKIATGVTMCCNPVGGTTGTCTVEGFFAP